MSRVSERIRTPVLVCLIALPGLLMTPAVSPALQETPPDREAEDHGQSAAGSAQRAPAIEILNARHPLPGILTGGQPTREQLTAAAEAGYRTVVNLRGRRETAGGEEAALAEELGLRYFAIPIAGSEDLSEENARQLAAVLAEEGNYPVLVHCASGNRVGALLAVKAYYADGKDGDEALAIGLEAGLANLEPKVRRILRLPPSLQD